MLVHQMRSTDKYLFDTEAKGPRLSTGIATAKFISVLVNGLRGEGISIASAYVRSDIFPSCEYMTSEIQFGPNGVEQNFGIPKMSLKEIYFIEQAAPLLNKIVNTATNFVHAGKIT